MIHEDEIWDKQSWFRDSFIEDLDSWFNADICCCDNCYDKFLQFWPLANGLDFQCSSIPLDCFYDGSKRIRESFTKEEFDFLIEEEHCPRCNSRLSGNIWVYSLPFEYDIDTFDFELNIERIYEISQKTPFLILNDKFAKETYDLLHEVSKITENTRIDNPLYRARISTKVSKLNNSAFGIPPKEVISERRYNHAGEQVLYLGSDIITCYNEVEENLCFVIECNINQDIKILDLSKPSESHTQYESNLNALAYSALMSRKSTTEGWNKPAYVFSRFISDCAKSAGFDAIKYPSTKLTLNNFNLVILNEEIFLNHITFNNLFFFNGYKEFKIEIID